MRHTGSRALRLTTILVVAFALLGAKVAPALAVALGDGTRTVLLCTGTGLVRVALDADGSVVARDADGDGHVDGGQTHDPAYGLAHDDARHCDLVASPRGDVERRWATIGRLATARAAPVEHHGIAIHVAARSPHDPPPRAPPVAG